MTDSTSEIAGAPTPADSDLPDTRTAPREPEADAARSARGRKQRKPSLLRETAIIVVAALVLSWLIKTFLVQAFYIPSESMENTLDIGDRVMVSRLVPSHLDLHRGDVIVFKDPGHWLPDAEKTDHGTIGNAVVDGLTFVGLRPNDAVGHLIKRVIGLPGDHVACAGPGQPVTVNGVAIDEPYLKPGSMPSQDEFDTTVPAGSLFVMGDNRQDSSDSRYNTGKPGGGFVPMDDVVGTAFIKVWPLSHAGILHNPSDTFADVPEPTVEPTVAP
ncbi:signal peptidase I [Luteimicrobium subarcticum]|uniref:Signal peptidase I n=1 Tax=Luteimicrobium subarcticum TaxID=620910 RepID=A0A2M8WU47_9MICO|nr:signal peptidase I [Luteimicrobium subarcticum]PJI94434.1 signal peptidase I [Luteimicrobium subarcticum]